MYAAVLGVDHASSAQREHQAAGGYKISVEYFKQRKQRSGKNDVDDPARADCLLECDGSHEWRIEQRFPRGGIGHGCDHNCVEQDSHDDGHHDGLEVSAAAEFRAGLFRRLGD